jgi:hypothetical protein
MEAHVDALVDRPDRARPRDRRIAAPELHVGERAPEVEHQIGGGDAAAGRRRRERADVDAHELRVVHRDRALGEHRGCARRTGALDQPHHLVGQPIAMALDAGDDGRRARRVQTLRRLARRLAHLPPIGAALGQSAVPFQDRARHVDRPLDHVAVDLEVAGAVLRPDLADHRVDVGGRGRRVREHARLAGELAVDAELRIDVLCLMVDERADLPFLVRRSAADDEDRHALGERAGDRVHHVVAARPVGDADDAEPPGRARVAVGCEADAGLVREGDDLEPARAPEAKKEPHHEIARDAEQMRDADLAEVGDQKVAEVHVRLHGDILSGCAAKTKISVVPFSLDAKLRVRDPPAAAFRAAARAGEAVAPRERKAAAETLRRLDHQALAAMRERALEMLEMIRDVAFGDADALGEVPRARLALEQGEADVFAHGPRHSRGDQGVGGSSIRSCHLGPSVRKSVAHSLVVMPSMPFV